MKHIFFLSLLQLGFSLSAYSQGSEIYSTTQIHTGGHYGVYNTLIFNQGNIISPRSTPNDNVYFTAGSTFTAASDISHIDGYAEKEGSTAFTFPIGNSSKLRTAGISAPASGNFKAAYFSENPSNATLPTGAPFAVTNLGAGVTAVSNLEYWDIDGASAVNVTLSWDAQSGLESLTANNIGNLIIAGYNKTTGKWENLGNAGGTTGALAAIGSITATNVIPDNYSVYTFAALATTPDLRPYTILTNVAFTAAETARPFTIRIRNVRTATTASDLVTVRVYKPTPASTVTLTGAAASSWTITNSGTYYTLTTNTDIPYSALGNSITGEVTISATTALGTYPLRVFIPDLSGGEVLADNVNNNLIVQLYKN